MHLSSRNEQRIAAQEQSLFPSEAPIRLDRHARSRATEVPGPFPTDPNVLMVIPARRRRVAKGTERSDHVAQCACAVRGRGPGPCGDMLFIGRGWPVTMGMTTGQLTFWTLAEHPLVQHGWGVGHIVSVQSIRDWAQPQRCARVSVQIDLWRLKMICRRLRVHPAFTLPL